jgi:chromosome segregation ATPase
VTPKYIKATQATCGCQNMQAGAAEAEVGRVKHEAAHRYDALLLAKRSVDSQLEAAQRREQQANAQLGAAQRREQQATLQAEAAQRREQQASSHASAVAAELASVRGRLAEADAALRSFHAAPSHVSAFHVCMG